jgi:hypothetical protein
VACSSATILPRRQRGLGEVEKLVCFGGGDDLQRANGSPEQCRVAFLANLPMLISRRHVRAYIACVAAGIPLQIITPTEANQLLYLAQTALSAWKDGGR